MQRQGDSPPETKPIGGMPATDDQIREKYLERAIRELNTFTRELQACTLCPRGDHGFAPVLGSGHPQADIFLLKHAPAHAEIEEGVAFYGRSGTAIMKSLKRLNIDPLVVYGTLCVKCPVLDSAFAAPECVARLVEEIAIVQPKMVVVMGLEALLTLNEIQLPLARTLEPIAGEVQKLTPSIDALYTPDIDGALDEEDAKREFWTAFRALGAWYSDFPPY
jgi:uracil-DNA glycosylase